ncbi:hypothetical protein J2046_002216 [Rhizobium petrolearium]|uniref:hypothetical protein n=1 Tax=Neorhizobium petrolearium TaxID=515361 RepID=UPI001AE810D9|nr:hypothetical protein [Neorhizobium petrolearium]MBP1843958.1 hypothetical protein [Neorhizobium petrolearium]
MSSRRRVEKVEPVSATSSSAAVETCFTTSITSDSDNAWVANRQSAINAALERRKRTQDGQNENPAVNTDINGDSIPMNGEAENGALDEDHSPPRLSGESERIGEWDWEESTPFGERVGYL